MMTAGTHGRDEQNTPLGTGAPHTAPGTLNAFDELFVELGALLGEPIGRGHALRTLTAHAGPTPAGDTLASPSESTSAENTLPLRVGPGASRGIILRSETFAELGSASVASASFVLATHDVSRVQDGRVRVIGPDIPDIAEGSTLPFGVAVLAAGRSLATADVEHLVECQYVTDHIEGYMIRSRPGCVWGRVSRDAANRGFTLAFLGTALAEIVRAKVPAAEAVEVLFVTSSDEDVRALDAIGTRAREIARELHREVWLEKGIDVDCPYGGHCGACSDKEVCDEVRKLAHIREQAKSGAVA